MLCPRCGKAAKDGARFCSSCGAPLAPQDGTPAAAAPLTDETRAPAAPVSAPAAQPAPAPAKKKKSRKGIILAAVLVVLVLALGVGAASLIFTPKVRVGMAVKKSADAYSAAAQALSALDVQALNESQTWGQELSMQITSLPDAELTQPLGLQLRLDADIPGEYVGLRGSLLHGGTSLISLHAGADGDFVYASMPGLLGKTCFGFHTTQLGQEIAACPQDIDPDGELSGLSFNIFQLCADYLKPDELDPAATEDLLEAIEVEKKGRQSLRVNGSSLSCTKYQLRIPADAIADFYEAWLDCTAPIYEEDNLRSMLEEIGLRGDTVDDMVNNILSSRSSSFDSTDYLLDTIRSEGKPVKLTLYLSGGYVVGIDWSGRGDYDGTSVQLRLGGGKRYADTLSLVLRSDDEDVLTLQSSGDHTLESGVFTDVTTLTIDSVSGSITCRYAPEESGSNFSLRGEIGDDVDRLSLDASGRIESDKQSLRVSLDSIQLYADEGDPSQRLECSFCYTIGACERGEPGTNPVSPFSLSETTVADLLWTAYENLDRLYTDCPELELLEDLFY